MSIFSSFFGCSKSQKTDAILPDITKVQEQEEGFSDLSLKIVEEYEKGNKYEYVVKGKFENNIVGLKIIIPNNIPAGIINGEIEAKSFLKNGITILSIGNESDNFLNALSKIYHSQAKSKFSTKPIIATVFPLNQMKADLSQPEYYKFKVFFNDEGDENEYAEIFINLNLTNKFIEFNEKDNEYRTNIIKALEEN